MALFRVIATAQVLFIVVQITRSQIEFRILRHTLPLELESTFGSSDTGGCRTVTSVDNLEICEGESVLNDGNTPSIVPDRTSLWATPLFTMRRNGTDAINVTFNVEIGNRDRVELAVFNCPERGTYAPSVNVYSDSTLNNPQTRWLIANKTLPDTSCDHLIKFCVDFNGATGLRFLTLEFPYQTNSSWVFLGEVTFLNGGSSDCDPPELINSGTPPPTTVVGIVTNTDISDTTFNNITLSETTKPTSERDSGSCRTSCVATALTTGVVSVFITAILVAGVSIGVHFAVYQCVYKPRMRGMENSVSGEGDTVTYEVVEERIGTVVKMEQNEAYGIARSS